MGCRLVFELEELEAREELVSEDDLGSLLELVGYPGLELLALDEGPVRGRQIGDHHRVVAHLQHGVRAGHRRDGDLERDALPTLYQYGYLMMANELCFWEREFAQARQTILGLEEIPPGCLF